MALTVVGLTKSFGGTVALRDVHLSVADGTVHALLGQNGAGKSTLIRCLGGAHPPDAGHVVLKGTAYSRLDPRQSRAAGVAIIYQNLSLVDTLSVSDNLFLGDEQTRWGVLRRSEQRREAAEVLERIGATCRPDDPVAALPMGQRQLVEIAKAVRRQASVLVLDEPTASLSGRETEVLLAGVRTLRAQGLAIVYVTHLLREVEAVADEVTVLRDGGVVLQGTARDLPRARLIAAITGEEHVDARPMAQELGGVVASIDSLTGPGFGPISLDVHAGEVVALHGLIGSGRTRMVETVAGARRQGSGRLLVDGSPVTGRTPRARQRCGVALVPGDRHRQGLFASMAALDNVVMPSFTAKAWGPVRRPGKERMAFTAAAQRIDIRPQHPNLAASSFSGGNQQKLLLARWMAWPRRLRLLVLDEPTQGVDVGAREEIYASVRELAATRPCAVLVSSADPDEVVALADRCLVVVAGRAVAELRGAEISVEALSVLAHQDPSARSEA